MYRAALIFGIWKHFGNGFQHSEAFVTDNEAYSAETSFFQPYKERTPALFILFHAFGSTNDFTASVLIDTDGYKDRDILDFATPAALEINTVNIDIRILAGKRSGMPLFDMFISFLVEVAYGARRYFCAL